VQNSFQQTSGRIIAVWFKSKSGEMWLTIDFDALLTFYSSLRSLQQISELLLILSFQVRANYFLALQQNGNVPSSNWWQSAFQRYLCMEMSYEIDSTTYFQILKILNFQIVTPSNRDNTEKMRFALFSLQSVSKWWRLVHHKMVTNLGKYYPGTEDLVVQSVPDSSRWGSIPMGHGRG
jgi:hypothetical protein